MGLAVGGGAVGIALAPTCGTGVTCLASGAMIWHGADSGSTALSVLIEGKPRTTVTARGLSYLLDISESNAQMLFDLVGAAASLKGASSILKNNMVNTGKLSASELDNIVSRLPSAGKATSGSLSGKSAEIPHKSTPENIRSIVRENESAQILSKNGYHVEQNPTTLGIKKPDYKINGEIFDNYAPSSSNIRNIWAGVEDKVIKGQTNNVVINISDSKVTVDALKEQFSKWKINGLDKIIIIDKSGNITRIK